MAMVGGFGASKPADDEVRAVFNDDNVKAGLAAKLGHAVDTIEVHHYKTQVVAGINFLAHVTINGKEHTVKVYRALPHTGKAPEVTEVHEGNAL